MNSEKKGLTISARIYLVIFSIVGFSILGMLFLVWSLSHLHERHEALLKGDVAETELALRLETTLKKEIQTWKELLIRGHIDSERRAYHDQIDELHSTIETMSTALRNDLQKNNDTKNLRWLDDFDRSRKKMTTEIKAAEAVYIAELEKGRAAGVVEATEGTHHAALIKADATTFSADDAPIEAIESLTNALIADEELIERELGDEVNSEITWTAVGMVAAFGVAGFLSFMLGRRISENLDNFVSRFHDVSEGEGDLTQRIAVTSQDELGKMAGYFNKLMGNLQDLMKQVQLSGIIVNSSSTEIAAGSREQEAAVAELAATAKEIAATTTEISATANELLQTMHDVSNVTANTASSAAQSKLGLENMERTMGQMVQSAGTITNRLSVLSEKASNISSVVTTIMKVADQTNLLSLNAAIEAEKAGEFGLGFAVVANEVRRLADQTAMASTDIEQMVKEMQSAVSAAVMGMDGFAGDIRHGADDVRNVAAQLGQIIGAVQQLVPRFDNVKEGMAAQTSGAAQIAEGVSMVVESSEQSAEALRQNNIAVQQLNEAAEELQASVNRFRVSENGSSHQVDQLRIDAIRRRAHEATSSAAAHGRPAALEKIAAAQRAAQAQVATAHARQARAKAGLPVATAPAPTPPPTVPDNGKPGNGADGDNAS